MSPLSLTWRLSPAGRVAIGLVALMLSIVLLADLFVAGFLASPTEEARRVRLLAAEVIGTGAAEALRHGDDAALRRLLEAAVRRDPGLRSARVETGGSERAAAGDTSAWTLPPHAPSTLDNLRVPIRLDGREWGELQLGFARAEPLWPWGWLHHPVVRGIAATAALGLLAFYLYIRRTMRYLDPSAAVPQRVRTAFDSLSEAVLVLDPQGRVMLANRGVRDLCGAEAEPGLGTAARDLGWLMTALQAREVDPPWERALAEHRPQLDVRLRIEPPSGPAREVLMNSSPVQDGFGRTRGVLVTFTDVTQLHERKRELRATIADLQATREELARKNEELTLLATRDPLTGSLNRRAFMAEGQRALEAAQSAQAPVCCVMCDVDHFKSINDRFGHAGGDEVLKAVVRALQRGLRTGDLLGRYGGEEFCILLPHADLDQALQIAERLRADVEAHVGSALRQGDAPRITMSFGVERRHGTQALDALIDRADQALYHSKKTGRNRVTPYEALETVA